MQSRRRRRPWRSGPLVAAADRTGGALLGLLVRLGGPRLWMAGAGGLKLVGVSALVALLALRMGVGAFLTGKRASLSRRRRFRKVMGDSGGERLWARCWLVELGRGPSLEEAASGRTGPDIEVAVGPRSNRRPFSTSGLRLTGVVALVGAALLLGGCSRTVPRLGSPAPSGTGSPARSGTTATGTAVTPTLVSPPLRNLDYRGIDPDTPAALNELQAAWEHGHQPWRASAPDVAKAHLLSLGYTDPTVGSTLTNARRENGQPLGEITYTVRAGLAAPGGVHGVVEVGQVREGGIFFVRGSQSGSLHLVAVDRRDGSVTATVATSDPGPVTGTVRQPGTPARHVRSGAPDAKGSATVSFEDPDPSSPVIVELRQRAVDGVSIVEARVQPVPKPNGTEALGPGGVLRLDGLGAVRIGMSLDEARSAAGVPLTLVETPHCTTLRPDAIPPGFVLTAPGGTAIDYVIVTGPIATAKGIRIGSKVIDVWNAYPGHLTDHLSVGPGGHSGRVVYQVKDPGFEGLAMIFVIADDHVTAMLAGRGIQTDGLCG